MTDLPKGWTELPLHAVATLKFGQAFDSALFGDAGEVPVARIRDVTRGWSSTFYSGPFDQKHLIDDGDVLIGMDGEFNRGTWRGGRAVLNQRVCKVSADGEQIDPRFLFHALPPILKAIEARTPSVTVKHLSAKVLRAVPLPLPPLEEQRRIAAILDKADELRAKRRAALEQLDTLTQAIFLDMFGDPAVNPRGWTVVQIGEVTASTTYGTAQKASSEGAVPVLRMGNLTATGAIDTTDVKFLDGADEKHRLRPGDVLFNRTNSADLVGKTAVFRLPGEWAYAGYLVRLRLTEDAAPDFVGTFMNLPTTKQRLRSMCKAIVGQANINATELQRIPMPLPPRGLQDDFARRLDAVERAKRRAAADECSLDALFASLQSRAFRGEL